MTEVYYGDKPDFVLARAEIANADIGEEWADVVFAAAIAAVLPDARMLEGGSIFEVGDKISVDISALAATEDASFRALVRNSTASAWRLLGSETDVTADETLATEIYSGNVRAHQMKLQVKYTSSDGGTAAVDVCIK